ncbi:hypothetical protein VQ044_25410, partial [Aurantimonas sp. C2-5-R2]|uniref:hypothetical protein n=1 Tax=Aurantimonas sp. C2-5-R2 TaxID=3113713 RepID=UPI002F929419
MNSFVCIVPIGRLALHQAMVGKNVRDPTRLWQKAIFGFHVLLDLAIGRHASPHLYTLPIRLLPTPTKCGVRPFPGVKPVKGRRSC